MSRFVPSMIGPAPGTTLCGVLVLCLLAMGARRSDAGKYPGAGGGEASGEQPEVLFTFDDGPHESHTKRILDTLEQHHRQAVFFWTGHRVTNEHSGLPERLALVQRAVQAGQLIGNHTTTHAKLCTVSSDQAAHEIDDNGALYESLSGLPMVLFRVPYGARCKRLDKMLSDRDLKHMHWDLDPQEFRHHSTDLAVQYVTRRLGRLANGKRAILLMHDTQPVTAAALPRILEWIDQENLRREKALAQDGDANAGSKQRRGRTRENKLPIRIMTGSEFVEERYPVPLLVFAREGVASALVGLRVATRLVLPRP